MPLPQVDPVKPAQDSISTLPKISVITVTLNCVNSIAKTIDSVLAQNYPRLQYILIDGGSTDGTWEIIQKYQEQLFYCESSPDRGLYDAINKGLRHVDGDLMAILQSGDHYAEGALRSVASAFQKQPFEMLLGEHCWELEQQTLRVSADPQQLKKGLAVCHQAVFYRPSLHRAIGDYDLRYPLAADYHFIRQVYDRHGIVSISQLLCYYPLGGVSDKNFMRYQREVRLIRLSLGDNIWLTQLQFKLINFKWWVRKILHLLRADVIINIYRKLILNYQNDFKLSK